jgi:NAD(P)-dependent dehydrogenase (short-subunit alcohol dehydrogenase family)
MSGNGSTRGRVLITGASTGIGEQCALDLAGLGFEVFAGVRRAEDGEALKAKARGRLEPLILDVTDPGTIEAARDFIDRRAGGSGMAGLVNNAGIVVAGPLEFVPLDELRRQLEVNVVGQIAVTRAFLPMIRAARGRIVNIGSIGGRMAVPFMGCYGMSKFAMEALSDVLRMELKPWGIHVSLIEPGAVKTPIWRKSRDEGTAGRAVMGPAMEKLYGRQIDRLLKVTANMEGKGVPPEEVSRVVIDALTSERPRTRYIVGREARAQALMRRILPDLVIDNIVLGKMGLPKAPSKPGN